MIRVLITDDQRLVRQSYRAILERVSGIEIVGEARDGLEAIALTQQLTPDVILMDIKMPRLDGLRATEQICARNTDSKILVIAMSWDEALVQQALKKGATGYIAKTEFFDELPTAVRTVYAGNSYFSKSIGLLLVNGKRPSTEKPNDLGPGSSPSPPS